ncbi:MAG: CBU_0592 family membrane protein [Nitrospiraceae bacterium]
MESAWIIQTISVSGAIMVLSAYALIQGGVWRELDSGYLALNLIGSVLLGVVALIERQAGFVLLEFAWAGLAMLGVWRAWKGRRDQQTT